MSIKPMKPKICKSCGTKFTSTLPLARVCSPLCALAIARKVGEKKAKAAMMTANRVDKVKRDALKPRGKWLAETKTAMQKMRRLQELNQGRGCISCGRSQAEVFGSEGWRPGGAWDGGHFLSKGARPELALEPTNIWLQCKSCNAGSGKYARKGYTVNTSFRINLVKTIGLEHVEWLEGPHAAKHYTIDDLKAIKADCNAHSLALLKAQE